MSSAQTLSHPFHLEGNFAPVFDERTLTDLRVEGSIPPELSGRFFRTGSNPQSGTSAHWFLGNGMIHGVRLERGRAVWYRNRYVRTTLFENPDAPRIRPDGSFDRTRVAREHARRSATRARSCALEEGSFPWLVSKDLDTIGVHDFGGKLKSAMTAHPRICPVTGELLFFGYDAHPALSHVSPRRADGNARPERRDHGQGPDDDARLERDAESRACSWTCRWSSTSRCSRSGGIPIRWSDDYGARLGVMPRDGSDKDVRLVRDRPLLRLPPDERVRGRRQDRARRLALPEARVRPGRHGRNAGDAAPLGDRHDERRRCSEQPLDDRPADFPRVADEARRTEAPLRLHDRHGRKEWASSAPSCYKYDVERASPGRWPTKSGGGAGEPVFARTGRAEDEGYVLTFVYDATRDASDLVIIDAQNFDGPGRAHPAAVPRAVRLPRQLDRGLSDGSGPMSLIPSFVKYAGAFEESYKSDDWAALAPYFAEDAVYEIVGMPAPIGGRLEGRDAILGYFKAVLDGFDRKFASRAIALVRGPREEGRAVWIRGSATYTSPVVPPLSFELEETTTFDAQGRHRPSRGSLRRRDDPRGHGLPRRAPREAGLGQRLISARRPRARGSPPAGAAAPCSRAARADRPWCRSAACRACR